VQPIEALDADALAFIHGIKHLPCRFTPGGAR
jgi:hypothetical protein